jgi:serine/threonine protein kinase
LTRKHQNKTETLQTIMDISPLLRASTHPRVPDLQIKFSGSTWRQVSPAAKDCIRAMLTPDPQQRPTAADLLQHPWLAAAAPATVISTSIMHQLQLFAGLSRARRVMLGVAASNINGSEASRLLKAFLAVDKDFNGTVEFHELAVAAKQVCPRGKLGPSSLLVYCTVYGASTVCCAGRICAAARMLALNTVAAYKA